MAIERLVEHLGAVVDPRCRSRVEHRLTDILVRLFLGSGVMAARHATRAAMRAPRRALPRRRALCTNAKKPR